MNSYNRTLIFFPILVAFTTCVNVFLFIFKGSPNLKLKKQPLYITLPIGIIITIVSFVGALLSIPILRLLVNKFHKQIQSHYRKANSLEDEEIQTCFTKIKNMCIKKTNTSVEPVNTEE